jgi:hypothetical protein
VRQRFAAGLLFGLRVVWPVLSALLVGIVGLGLLVGLIEGWSVSDSIYFAFVSGLTIGYGDLAPKTFVARVLAIMIGICGVLLTGLVAAVAVKALSAVRATDDRE